MVRSNRSLPTLEPTAALQQPADLSVHFGTALPESVRNISADVEELFYTSMYQAESGEPLFRTWKLAGGSLLRTNYFDGTQFWIDLEGGNIWAQWSKSSSFEDTVSYLLGPVFGFVLRMRGVVCLHASAVVREGRAVAFLGMPGAGKSTTAAALAQRGHVVVSDDIVALAERDGGFYAAPAYPYLSLWPESVEALYGAGKSVPAFSGTFQKRRLSLSGGQFASGPVPLGAIFILGERVAEPLAPHIEEMASRDALITLVANTYANMLLNEELRAREFEFLGRLVEAVPVRRIHAHRNSARIGSLCELIEGELTKNDVAAVRIAARP